jgi:hypothetical protein
VNEPSTWGSFVEVVGYLRENAADPDVGAGYVFTEEDGMTAIDFDHVIVAKLDERTGLVNLVWEPGSEPVQALLRQSPLHKNGYAEVSPSGTGIHIFIRGRLPEGVNHTRVLDKLRGMKVEAWDCRRYVTVTGVRIPGESGAIVENPPLLASLADFLGMHDTGGENAAAEPERREEIAQALKHLDPDVEYDKWIRIGMALRAGLGPAGRELWVEWSKKGSKYVPGEPEVKWASFAGSGVGLGTLIRLAQEAGYKPPRPTAQEVFADDIEKKPAPEPSDLRIVLASELTMTNPDWLWYPRITVGELGLLVGDPGIGKSLVIADVAARLSRGLLLPGAKKARPPSRVLYLNAEDHATSKTLPRLIAAGADLRLIHVLDVGSRNIRLPSDVAALRALILKFPGVVFVVLDPLASVLDPGLDSNSMTDVRRATDPFAILGADLQFSPFENHHFAKSTERAGIYRVAGSVGIVGATRQVLAMNLDPEEEEGSPVRLLGIIKTNANKADTLRLAIREKSIPGYEDTVGYIEWLGTSGVAGSRLTDGPQRPSSKVNAAEAWLDLRMAGGDPTPARLVLEEGHAAGHSESALQRASVALKVEKTKTPGGWIWRRP